MISSMGIHTDTVPRYAYSLDETARAINLSRSSLYELIDSGELKTVKLGRRRLVPRAELERILSPALELEAAHG
jgi:excisionase family DNA binding protein